MLTLLLIWQSLCKTVTMCSGLSPAVAAGWCNALNQVCSLLKPAH